MSVGVHRKGDGLFFHDSERSSEDSAHDVERAVPASLIEEMDQHMTDEGNAVANAGLLDLVFGRLKRPVDKHGAADDVLARDKAPEPAVQRLGAVVAHRE